jgi:DNA repair exonuclease SbcCD ATPase subunit
LIRLAKNTRNLCRKYYKNKYIIEILKKYRSDQELILFAEDFDFMLKNSTKKCKMTFEEEKSDLALNLHLNEKIEDLEKQITEKQNKYEKLKKERQDFKTNCINKIQEIEKEIDMIKNSTEKELGEIENKINKDLNEFNEKHQKNIQELKEKVSTINAELEKKRNENEQLEKNYGGEVNTALNGYMNITDIYDVFMGEHKDMMDNFTKEIQDLTIEFDNKNKQRDKLKKKYLAYEAAHKKHQDRLSKLRFDEDVKVKAAEWIQAQFRGFFMRKTKRKNYKFLNVLKKPDPAPALPPKGGK